MPLPPEDYIRELSKPLHGLGGPLLNNGEPGKDEEHDHKQQH